MFPSSHIVISLNIYRNFSNLDGNQEAITGKCCSIKQEHEHDYGCKCERSKVFT